MVACEPPLLAVRPAAGPNGPPLTQRISLRADHPSPVLLRRPSRENLLDRRVPGRTREQMVTKMVPAFLVVLAVTAMARADATERWPPFLPARATMPPAIATRIEQ